MAGRRVGAELLGAVIAPDEAVGVGVDGLGGLDRTTRTQDLDPADGVGRVVAERDGLAHEGGVDLIDDAMEADRAVLLDLAFLLEKEDLTEVAARELDVGGGGGPSINRGRTGEAAVRRVVILVFDPRPQSAIERVEVARVRIRQRGEELRPYCTKPALDFSFGESCRLRLMRVLRNESFASPTRSTR